MTDTAYSEVQEPMDPGTRPPGYLGAVSIKSSVFDAAPSYTLSFTLCKIPRSPSSRIPYPQSETLRKAEEALRSLYPDTTAFGHDPQIEAWRDSYRAFQVNPRRYPRASDVLGQRVIKGKDLPRRGPIVDACNALPLSTRLPIASCDLEGIAPGTLSIRRASGAKGFTPRGSSNIKETVDPGEVMYADSRGRAHSRRWNWMQSHELRTTASSKNLLLTVESVAENSVDAVRETSERLLSMLAHSGHRLCFLSVFTAQPDLNLGEVLPHVNKR